MAAPRDAIQAREHEEIPYSDLTSVRELETLVGQTGKQVFRFYRNRLKTTQFVGLVQTEGQTIEILPKVYRQDVKNLGFLVLLLRLTGTADLPEMGTAGLNKIGGSFLQIWIRHFAETLFRLLTHQFERQYVEVERETGFIRGRLQVEAMQSGREELSGKFPCRYEVYTPDHRMNQVLKRCSQILLREATSQRAQVRLRGCLDLLDGVSGRAVRAEEIGRIQLNRLNQDYEPVLDLCKLLLRDSSVGVRAGIIDQIAVVFNMNTLFESAVAALLRRFRNRLQIGGRPIRTVKVQEPLGRLYEEFPMRVDLAVEDENGDQVLIDTKYKTLGEKAHGGLSQADFYQMHAYATAGDRQYDRVILLYPSRSPVQKRFSSGDVDLFVRSIDLRALHDPETGRLRRRSAIEELQGAFRIP